MKTVESFVVASATHFDEGVVVSIHLTEGAEGEPGDTASVGVIPVPFEILPRRICPCHNHPTMRWDLFNCCTLGVNERVG